MVFEAIVVDILNKFLKEYVENLDTSQLKIAIWGGDVVLADLIIKQTILQDLDLPFKVAFGKLGKLSLRIPWKNLYGEPTLAIIENFFVILVPNTEIQYDAVKEEKWIQEKKQRQLKLIEEAKNRELEKDAARAQDTFVEKLVMQIVKTIQIDIKNIHIRYEDKTTDSEEPFSVGLTISNLSLMSSATDPFPPEFQGNKKLDFVFKTIHLKGLAIYWNPLTELLTNLEPVEFEKILMQNIPHLHFKPEGFKYILGPIMAKGFLRINPKPEIDGTDYAVPKLFILVDMEEIKLAVSRRQYRSVSHFLQGLQMMFTSSKYRKYRPFGIPIVGHAKIWWDFAYNAVTEDIKRRKLEWNWEHIKKHREMCRRYAELFSVKWQSKKLSKYLERELEDLEKKLNVFDLILLREQVYVEIERLSVTKNETKASSGWFSYFFSLGGASKSETEKEDLVTKFEKVMTPKEKEKLYKAIDYQENISKATYPNHFVEFKFFFKLHALRLRVFDDKMDTHKTMTAMSVCLKNCDFLLEQRPSANAMKLAITLGDFSVTGKAEEDHVFPEIVKSSCTEFEKLIEILFETNPLDANCDQLIHVNANALSIIYHAKTVNLLLDIFKVDADENMATIVAATAASLPTFQEITSMGLQYAIDKSAKLELKAHILASKLIIPYGGTFEPEKEFVIIKLGQLNVTTEERPARDITVRKLYLQGSSEKDIFTTFLSASYRRFKCQLEGVQIVHRLPGEKWMGILESVESSPLRLLEPTNLTITVKKCLVTDDARIPKAVVEGKLPSISLNISEDRLICLAGLVSSIPTPNSDSESTMNKRFSASAWSLQSFGTQLETKLRQKVNTKERLFASENYVQGIDLVARFTMNEFIISVSKVKIIKTSQDLKNSTMFQEKFLQMSVLNFESELTCKTFETVAEIKLGAIEVKQNYNGVPILVVETKELDRNYYLLSVEFTNVDKKIPDFFSKRGGVLTIFRLNFTSLNVILHKEAIIDNFAFVSRVQTRLQEVKDSVALKLSENVARKMTSIMEDGVDVNFSEKKIVSKGKKFRKTKQVGDVIDWVVEVMMNSLCIRLTSDVRDLFELSVKGGKVELSMRKSYTNIDCKLSDVLVVDLNPVTLHKKVVTSAGEQTLFLKATLFDKGYLESSKSVDISIEAEIGRIRCVFLKRFINAAVDFMNTFQKETFVLRQRATVAAQKAKEGVIKVYENEAKVSLNIKIMAPLILFPKNSSSTEVLIVDMGTLTIKSFITELEVASSSENQIPRIPLIDVIRFHLDNVKLTRAVLNSEDMLPVFETSILDPVTLELTLNRNLSVNWYIDAVHLHIQGRLELIHVTLTHSDLCFIIIAFQENFFEGELEMIRDIRPPVVFPECREDAQENEKEKEDEEFKIVDVEQNPSDDLMNNDVEKSQAVVVFSFLTDRFIFDTINDSQIEEKNEKVSTDLAKFVLETISIKGTIFSDGSMITAAFLSNIAVDDIRPGKQGRITNLMEKKVEHDANSRNSTSVFPSMLNLNYQKKGLDSFVDVRVYGFNLILSMDFISKLLKFFTVDDLITSHHGASQIQTKPTEVKITGSTVKSAKPNTQEKKDKGKKDNSELVPLSTFTINLRLEKPDIIIVENMDSLDAEAIIFNTELVMKYRSAGSRQVISGTLSDIGLISCCFNPFKRAQTTSQIIKPFTISMAGSTPEDQGLHVDICLTDIYLSISAKTVELINKCRVTLMSDSTQGESKEQQIDYSDLWSIKTFQDNDYWFLRTEQGVDALLTLPKQSSHRCSRKMLEEICLISVPAVVITIEDVTVKSKMPLVLFEMSLQGQIRNWSSQLTIDSLVKIQMQYFNKSVSAWEPLIEPSEVIRDKKPSFAPWELDCNIVFGNEVEVDMESVEKEVDLTPNLKIAVSSSENLEITITKSCLDVLENLAEAFTSAVTHTAQVKSMECPPYIVKNDTGVVVELLLEKSHLDVYKKRKESYKIVELDSGGQIELQEGKKKCYKLSTNERSFIGEKKNLNLHFKCSLFPNEVLKLPISRTIKRYYPITDPSVSQGGENWGLILDVDIVHNSQVITLRSVLQIINHFQEAINIHYVDCKGKELEYIGTVEENSVFNLPIHSVYSEAKQLYFSVKGYSICNEPLSWNDIKHGSNTSVLLRCNPKNLDDTDPFFIMAIGEMEQVYLQNSYRRSLASVCINVHLQPTLELLNCLPIDIIVCSQGVVKERSLSSGERLQIPQAEPGISVITLRICNYLEREWSCKEIIPAEPTNFLVWTFTSYNGLAPETIHIGLFYSTKRSSAVYTIYCPYLMVNQTGHMLSYRFDDNASPVFHPSSFNKPLMFSPGAKGFYSKKKALMKVNQGEWSDKFPIDVAGSGGTIECYDQSLNCRYLISVTITLTFNNLTKIVLLTPYFVLLNKTNYIVQCQECDATDDTWITIEPENCKPFWPLSKKKRKTIRLKLMSSQETTCPFFYDSTDSILLKLNDKSGGLFVDIQTTNSGTNIVIYPYESGLAPALILNHTQETLEFQEQGTENSIALQPHQMCLYSWEKPTEERKLSFYDEKNNEYSFNLREDVEGHIKCMRNEIGYISFLDGIQRVLLFTEDKSVALDSKLAGHFQNSGVEVFLKMQGIGISLVNNVNQTEILYMGFVSSGISWETKKENRSKYKAMPAKDSYLVENAYSKYQEGSIDGSVDSVVVIDNKIQVNFDAMEMIYPQKKKLRRVFEPGLWAVYRSSDNYITLHIKVNKIQIDNQLYDSIFPVVLAPVPPPKSVSVSNDPKPFFELSVLKVSAGQSRVQQYKYFRILIQEFSIKIDIGFITQFWSFLSADNVTDEVYKAKFKKDIIFCEEPLLSHVTVSSTSEQKNFYDLLHFSPLKVHFSFSLAGNFESSLLPPALSVLLQSLGVTLTDLNDVVMRLSYFERKSAFLTNGQLQSEVIRHYYGQAIRQAYVLLLGLDVIGNPFGLVIGIGQGVEAFFYEPVLGIIQGPSDFATGVALGCRSLFGHTVGGTAGTLGKITGTLGKGLAVLTLDKEYQRERMEQQNRRFDTISTSMAQGGKGVVMGVYEGVAGVVMKPISGAKEEGVGGFFKGVGKGMMGLVTRPVTGVVDFASTSLNAVKRATEQNVESTRIRPPRFFRDDKLVMPYKKHEAYGNSILFEIEKRKYCKTDKYEYHAELRGKEILLLTNKRMLLTEHSDVFGSWQVHLEITWEEMSFPPSLHQKGVAINMPRTRTSVFQSHKDTKILAVDDPQIREVLFNKMVELYTAETGRSI